MCEFHKLVKGQFLWINSNHLSTSLACKQDVHLDDISYIEKLIIKLHHLFKLKHQWMIPVNPSETIL